MDHSVINDILNLAGFGFSAIGTALLFIHTPKVNFDTVLYFDSEQDDLTTKAKRLNQLIRLGMICLLIGILCQSSAFIFLKYT